MLQQTIFVRAPGVVVGLGQQVLGCGEEQGLSGDGQEGGEGAGVSSRHQPVTPSTSSTATHGPLLDCRWASDAVYKNEVSVNLGCFLR